MNANFTVFNFVNFLFAVLIKLIELNSLCSAFKYSKFTSQFDKSNVFKLLPDISNSSNVFVFGNVKLVKAFAEAIICFKLV